MSLALVQFDFLLASPRGDEMAGALQGLAQDIASKPDLVWKIWTQNPDAGRAGGIHGFSSAQAAAAYREKHSARLADFGISGMVAHSFQVNAPLSAITRAPF
ncbi:MAG: monooxygenase [Pararhodobacter sp.]